MTYSYLIKVQTAQVGQEISWRQLDMLARPPSDGSS